MREVTRPIHIENNNNSRTLCCVTRRNGTVNFLVDTLLRPVNFCFHDLCRSYWKSNVTVKVRMKTTEQKNGIFDSFALSRSGCDCGLNFLSGPFVGIFLCCGGTVKIEQYFCSYG